MELVAEQSGITDRLTAFVVQTYPMASSDGFSVDAQLLEDGIIDSLGMIGLVDFIEEEFRVYITDEDLTPENFSSIATIAQFLVEKVG